MLKQLINVFFEIVMQQLDDIENRVFHQILKTIPNRANRPAYENMHNEHDLNLVEIRLP